LSAVNDNALTRQGQGVGNHVVSGQSRQPNFNPVERVLQLLEGVKRSGKGWRARCPACGGKSEKLTIAEGDDGRALIHCFACSDTPAILEALGLRLSDVMPFRAWPDSPDDKRRARRAIREAGLYAAVGVLAREATVVQIAGAQITKGTPLDQDDTARLALAVFRIDKAREVLCD